MPPGYVLKLSSVVLSVAYDPTKHYYDKYKTGFFVTVRGQQVTIAPPSLQLYDSIHAYSLAGLSHLWTDMGAM